MLKKVTVWGKRSLGGETIKDQPNIMLLDFVYERGPRMTPSAAIKKNNHSVLTGQGPMQWEGTMDG